MGTIIDKNKISELEPLILEFLDNVVGYDISISQNKYGFLDINVLGGDISLSGAYNSDKIFDLIKNRIILRLLSTMSIDENGVYGTFLSDFVGKVIADNNVTDRNVITISEFEDIANAIVNIALNGELYVDEVTSVKAELQDEKINLGITFKSIFLNELNVNFQLFGS